MDLTEGASATLRSGDVDEVTTLREVAKVLRQPGLATNVESALIGVPAFCAQYERARRTGEARASSPSESDHSLAAVLRAFQRHYSLGPNFFPFSFSTACRPLEYAAWLLARDHDAYHVLCEYETSDRDEVALQSFVCGQAPCVFGYFIAMVEHAPELTRASFKHLRDLLDCEIDREALLRGRRARSLLALDSVAQAGVEIDALRSALAIGPRGARPSSEELRNTCGGRDARAFF
jgi:ubiquinone biosynthesis protein COQ4